MAAPRSAPLAPLLVMLGGCADDPPSRAAAPARYQPLVSATEWTEVAREQDPLVADAAQAPACVGPGFFVENDWIEIDTGLCNWVTLEASSRFAVAHGQQLRLIVSHYDLGASTPGEGVVHLQFGACEVWQKSVAIPNPAAVYEQELAAPCDLERGGRVLFHLHNHGQNHWQLQELSLLR